jgi:tetratricopeptide (TPR) repeat protein
MIPSFRSQPHFALVSLVTLLLSLHVPIAQAQDTAKPKFPFPNPIEMREPDPALPLGVFTGQRSPTTLEVRQLQSTVERLQAEGEALYAAANPVAAFDVWFRELRLRRYFDLFGEIKALGRVGGVAWDERETTALRVITERLQQIEQGMPSLTLSVQERVLLEQVLGQAYENVRATELASVIYQQELERAQRERNVPHQELALTAMGELYFKDLNFPAAIARYQSLLELVRQNQPKTKTLTAPRRSLTTHNPTQRFTLDDPIGKPLTELEILTQLAYLYEKNQQYGDVITTQEAIIALYAKAGQPEPIPSLKAAIAKQYQTLKQTDRAMVIWQEVYNLAIGLQQYSYAADALYNLATYYRAQNQMETALGLYQYLLDVQMRGDDWVGQLDALDQIGQIHRAQKNYPQAVIAFQRGLAIAQRLRFRQDYFATQLDQAKLGQ